MVSIYEEGALVLNLVFLFCMLGSFDGELALDGIPIQLEFHDLNQDGSQDIIGLMLRNKTIGDIDAYYEEGGIRAAYSETTLREKYLVWIPLSPTGAGARSVLELGTRVVNGFQVDPNGLIHLWTEGEIWTLKPKGDSFVQEQTRALPETALPAITSAVTFPWQVQFQGQTTWLFPDFQGLHTLTPAGQQHFLPFPRHIRKTSNRDQYFEMTIPLPQIYQPASGSPLLLLNGGKDWFVSDLNGESHLVERDEDFVLRDMNSDGLLDVLIVHEVDDIDGPSDLPKVKSEVQLYTARAPYQYEAQPDYSGSLGGFIIQGMDEEMSPISPFFDLNHDGLTDIGGFAFKLSVFQMVKAVSLGRITITFLMHFHIQENGKFRTLAGGPFEVRWKFNFRKMKMPEFAQITADLDGDGWVDIFVDKGGKLEITPLDNQGIRNDKSWSYKLPKTFRESDEIFSVNLDSDPADELIFLKFDQGTTHLGWAEVSR
ncbi:MAG: hypothetical protein H6510_15125 [Acidobacteria bacterium]|nr:hypothetical protein [Acidobacteriota bacterium]